MNEAHGLADWICETLEKVGIKDGGAEYAVTVTDTAGNVAEVFFEKSEAYGGPRWIWEEGCNVERLNLRVAHAVRERAAQRYVQLPGEALEKLRLVRRDLDALSQTSSTFIAEHNSAFLAMVLTEIIDAARWIA